MDLHNLGLSQLAAAKRLKMDHLKGESLFTRIFFKFCGEFFRIGFLMDFPPNTRHPDKGTSITESHISTLKHCLLVTGGFKVEMAIST